jgi:hypothetical protein
VTHNAEALLGLRLLNLKGKIAWVTYIIQRKIIKYIKICYENTDGMTLVQDTDYAILWYGKWDFKGQGFL